MPESKSKSSNSQTKKGGECVNRFNEMTRGNETGTHQGSVKVGKDKFDLQARSYERGGQANASTGRATFGNQNHGHYGFAERGHGNAEAGPGGVKAEGGVGRNFYGYKDGDTHIRAVNFDAGGKLAAGAGGVAAKADLGIDLAKVETRHVDANVGVNLSTGGEVGPDGVSAKVLGLGGAVNSRGIAISTPLGGIGFKW